MTETCSLFTVTPLDEEVSGSFGVLLPNNEAKIVDPKTGRSLGPHAKGELYVRGPHVSQSGGEKNLLGVHQSQCLTSFSQNSIFFTYGIIHYFISQLYFISLFNFIFHFSFLSFPFLLKNCFPIFIDLPYFKVLDICFTHYEKE